jgi:hypothetical protein
LADYTQNVKVTADTRDAERSIAQLSKKLGELQNLTSGTGRAAGTRNIAEAFVPQRALSALERGLQTIANRANTTEKAFARLVEGVGTLEVTSQAINGLNEVLKDAASYTAQVAQSASGATRHIDQFTSSGSQLENILGTVNNGLVDLGHSITRVVVPGFAVLDDAAQASAKTVNAAQYAVQQLVDSTEGIKTFVDSFFTISGATGAATAGIAALAAVVEGQLSNTLYDIDRSASGALGKLADDAAAGVSELQRLIGAGKGTVSQYENLLRLGKERQALYKADSEEGRKAVNTIYRAQTLLNEELERQNDLLRAAKGLQPQDVRDYEVGKRRNALQSRDFKETQATKQSQEEAALQANLLKIQGREVSLLEEKLGIQRNITNEVTLQAQKARDGKLDGSSRPIRPYRTVEGVRAMGFPIALPEIAQDRKLAALKKDRAEATQSLALQKSNSLLASDLSLLRAQLEIIKALGPAYEPFLNGLKKANDRQSLLFRAKGNRATRKSLGDENVKRAATIDDMRNNLSRPIDDKVNNTNRLLVAQNKLYEIGAAIKRNDFATAKALGAQVDLLIKQENNYTGVLQRRLAFRRKEKAEAAALAATQTKEANKRGEDAAKEGRKRLEGVAIGGAFPLLFGGGPGAVLGGALGGLNTNNPIFSVVTSAIGQVVDQFAAAAADMGSALRDPITNFQKITDAGLLASKSQEYYISRLIEVGRITEATAIIQGEMVKKIGVSGVNDLTKLGESSVKLAKAWAELNLQMQAALAGPLAELLDWITSVVKIFGEGQRASAEIRDIAKGLNKDQRNALYQDLLKNTDRYGSTPKAYKEEANIIARYRAQANPQQLKPSVTDDPQTVQDAADKRLDAAERAEALRRQGIQLERQKQDLDLQIADQVYGFRKRADDLERATLDLRRSIEDEIFKKRQDVTRLESDNARQQAQLAIDRLDMQLAGGRASGNVPGQDLANSLLDAVRQYVKTRAEGEANLQLKERQHIIEMEELKRASEKFRFDVARKVSEIERQGVELNRDIERAKLTTARAIYDLQVQGADYQRDQLKNSLQDMAGSETATAQRLAGTNALTQQISGGGSSGGAAAVLTAAERNLGLFAGVTEQCANAMRELFKQAKVPIGVTKNAWDGLGSGSALASSFFGSDIGKKITNIRDLKPGDLVGFDRTYGNWGPGVQTHVGVYAGGGMMYDHSSRRGLTKRPLDTFGGKFMYGVRPYAYGGAAPAAAPAAAAAAPMARPAIPASVGQAQAQLGGIKLPGSADVSALMASMGQLDQKLLSAKTNALELAKAFAQMGKEQAAQLVSQAVTAVVDQLNAPLDQLLKSQKDAAAFQREYAGLIEQGTNPALAEQVASIREQVRLQLEQLDTAVKQLDAQKALLDAEAAKTGTASKWTEELQKQLDLLNAQRGIIEGKGSAAESFAREEDAGKRTRDYMTKLRGELSDTEGRILSLAGTIESEIGSSMSTAVTNVITGAGTVEQAIGQMFSNIGKAFIDMATQMLAKALMLKVLGILGGGVGGLGAAASSGGFNPLGFTPGLSFLASGGPMAAGKPYIVGEEGPELVLPSQGGYVLNADDTQQALAQSRGALPMGGSTSGTAFSENRDALNTISSTTRERQVERVLTSGATSTEIKYSRVGAGDLPFVTEQDMLQATRVAAQEGARMGQQRTMAALKNNPGARRTIGI